MDLKQMALSRDLYVFLKLEDDSNERTNHADMICATNATVFVLVIGEMRYSRRCRAE